MRDAGEDFLALGVQQKIVAGQHLPANKPKPEPDRQCYRERHDRGIKNDMGEAQGNHANL